MQPLPHVPQRSVPRHQRGAAMLFAIAIIVVASLLGAAMVRMLRVDQDSVARDVLSTRALLAADSAAQRALAQIFNSGTPSVNCTSTVNGSSITFAVDGLRNCRATLQCVVREAAAATPDRFYAVRSTGFCGPAGDEASRQVEVLARDVPTG